MENNRRQSSVLGEEQNPARGPIPAGANITSINHYYHAPVNNVGQANNCNFGVNNGLMEQTAQQSSSPSTPSGGMSGSAETHRSPSHHTAPSGGLVIAPRASLASLLNPIPDASHTRNRALSPPNSRCFPGTRKKVTQKIYSWIDSTLLFSPHIMWIYGYAGCGKSAIAQIVAECMSRQGRLAACFFFFRGSGDRSTAARFATTIAAQIAAAIPSTAPFIKAAIDATPGLLSTTTTTLTAQFQHLVYDPIDKSARKRDRVAASLGWGTYLVVLDGVDECGDRDEIATLIADMIEYFDKRSSTPLRFLITSRVENHLYQRLHSSKQVKLLNLVQHTSDVDISTALDVAIAEEKRGLPFACEAAWPCPEDRMKLVKHIGGSYIFMTTIIRSLFDPSNGDNLTPMERLPLLLAMRPDFDELYQSTLGAAQDVPHFHHTLSTVALAFEPLSITQIAELLGLETFKIAKVLTSLHSVIQVPGDDRTPVTLWHTSLRDFLCDMGRSGPFHASLQHHQRLAYSCTSLAAAPTASANPFALTYSECYALKHWASFGETLWDDPDVFIQELVKFFTHVHSAFASSSREATPTLFSEPVTPDGETALEFACLRQKWDLVRAVVNAGANVNAEFQKDDTRGFRVALHAACYYEAKEMICFLLDKGADPNIVASQPRYSDWGYHTFPLAWAAAQGDVDLVNRLLACGADPNLKGGWYDWSALHACAWGGKDEVARILLECGVDPNIQAEDGWTPLHWVSVRGYTEVVKCLLEFQADPNTKINNGWTPLHLACFNGRLEVAEYLLDHNADPSIRDIDGDTALQLAQRQRKQDIAVMLTRRGITE